MASIAGPARADRDYVRLLHLAASTSEADVEVPLGPLREQRIVPTFDAVRDLIRTPGALVIPVLSEANRGLGLHDQLLAEGGRYA